MARRHASAGRFDCAQGQSAPHKSARKTPPLHYK